MGAKAFCAAAEPMALASRRPWSFSLRFSHRPIVVARASLSERPWEKRCWVLGGEPIGHRRRAGRHNPVVLRVLRKQALPVGVVAQDQRQVVQVGGGVALALGQQLVFPVFLLPALIVEFARPLPDVHPGAESRALSTHLGTSGLEIGSCACPSTVQRTVQPGGPGKRRFAPPWEQSSCAPWASQTPRAWTCRLPEASIVVVLTSMAHLVCKLGQEKSPTSLAAAGAVCQVQILPYLELPNIEGGLRQRLGCALLWTLRRP